MGGLQFLLTKLVIVLYFNIMIISAGRPTKVCTERSRIHKQGVCGASIPKVLSALCGKSGYVEKVYKRSSEPSPSLEHIADMDAKTFLTLSESSPEFTTALSGLLHTKREASMFLNKRGDYYHTGISCECCYHKCTVRELASYCKDGDRILARLGGGMLF